MTTVDKSCYAFHEDDQKQQCFHCRCNSSKFYILRHDESMKMVHLCEECMLHNPSDYFLDNTRPWVCRK